MAKTTRLERRHLNAIADIINAIPNPFLRFRIARHFAYKCQFLNDRFNRDKFMLACAATGDCKDAWRETIEDAPTRARTKATSQ